MENRHQEMEIESTKNFNNRKDARENKTYDINYETKNNRNKNKEILDEFMDSDRHKFELDKSYLLYYSTTFEEKLEYYKRYLKNNYFASFCVNIISSNDFRNVIDELIKNECKNLNHLYKYSILKYRFCNYLGFEDLILDKFFDNGFSSYENLNSDISTDLVSNSSSIFVEIHKARYQLRETIIIDSNNDELVKQLLDKASIYAKDNTIYQKLINLILIFFGKSDEMYKFNKFMNSKHRKQNIYLGDIRYGLDRHKSLLFKYLCDNLGLNCCIVRKNILQKDLIYEDHCWNIIIIDKQKIVIDFKNYPGRQIIPDNKFTIEYYQLNLI